MIRTLIFCVLLASSINTYSQKEMLTKQETANYLNKKCKEAIGYSRIGDKYKSSYRLTGIELSLSECTITYQETKDVVNEGNVIRYLPVSYKFNPKDIKSLSIEKEQYGGGSAGIIKIFLNGKTGLWRTEETGIHETSVIEIHFLASDESNFTKIKKAFEHLRDLCKAEDDPFGN